MQAVPSVQEVALIPGASQNTSAAILSSVAFDRDAEMFAAAGVSKRIFIYHYDNAVEAYGRESVGQVVFQLQSLFLACLS